VFLAIAVDNLADADALGDNEAKDDDADDVDADDVVYEVRSIQRNARDVRNVRNVTKWRHYWIGLQQAVATTAYAAGTLPSCGRQAIKYEIIWIKFDLHHKLHK